MNELAASVVHELNQPLAAMVTSAETCLLWLDMECPDLDRVRNAAQRIVRAGHHAGNVMRGIRTLLRGLSPQSEHILTWRIFCGVLRASRPSARIRWTRTSTPADTRSPLFMWTAVLL